MHALDPDLTRRALLVRGAGALPGASIAGGLLAAANASAATPSGQGWYAPADHLAHSRTWMAWPARKDVWGDLLGGARSDVARVARAIAAYEPVSMVARPDQAAGAAAACGSGVDVVQLVNDDLWMRDIGPIFLVNDSGGLAGLDLNFNGWGNKQVHHNDAKIAGEVLSLLDVPTFVAPFVSEGGALEVDGDGTVLATESSIINANRNPGKTKARLTREILAYLGARKMLWVPGLKGHDITDDHIDGLARFVKPTKVVVDQPADPNATDVWAKSERQALRILRRSTDAVHRPLRLPDLERVKHDPAGSGSEHVRQRLCQLVCVQRGGTDPGLRRPRRGRDRENASARALPRSRHRAAPHRHARSRRRRDPLHHPTATSSHTWAATSAAADRGRWRRGLREATRPSRRTARPPRVEATTRRSGPSDMLLRNNLDTLVRIRGQCSNDRPAAPLPLARCSRLDDRPSGAG